MREFAAVAPKLDSEQGSILESYGIIAQDLCELTNGLE